MYRVILRQLCEDTVNVHTGKSSEQEARILSIITVSISYHPQTTCLLALNFSAELSGKIRLQREVQLNSILVDVKTLRHSQNPVKMITDIQKGSFWVTFAIKSCIRLNKNTLVAFILNATTLQ